MIINTLNQTKFQTKVDCKKSNELNLISFSAMKNFYSVTWSQLFTNILIHAIFVCASLGRIISAGRAVAIQCSGQSNGNNKQFTFSGSKGNIG